MRRQMTSRALSLALVFVFVFALVGCGTGEKPASQTSPLRETVPSIHAGTLSYSDPACARTPVEARTTGISTTNSCRTREST